jgi:hypothetical protein
MFFLVLFAQAKYQVQKFFGGVGLLEEKHQEKLPILPFWQSIMYLGLLNR